jgi:hypothetical protein
MRAYLNSWSHHRQCFHLAQRDVCQSVLDAVGSAWTMDQDDLQRQVNGALAASLALWQVHADSQRDLHHAVEQWWHALHALWLSSYDDEDYPFTRVLRLSDASGGAMAKVTRQVSYFAATRLPAAAVNAAREAHRAWHDPGGLQRSSAANALHHCNGGCRGR